MPRKILVKKDGLPHALTQVIASNEEELQELVKERPDILPFEEYGLAGPLMVIGRETTLPSGAVDLIGLARSGDVLIIEFKTGPQNTDFRAALSQLLDYGSDIWGMSFDEFESTVALRYFASDRCKDNTKGKVSLAEAQSTIWPDMSSEERISFKEILSRQLEDGGFHYLLVSSRLTKTSERTIEYLNSIATSARFYGIELVPFAGDGISAYETRTIVKPTQRPAKPKLALPGETQFLSEITDEAYRNALHELFEVCRGLGLKFEWGTTGTSIRLITADSAEPISIGWVFPTNKPGWMGLVGVNLGYDAGSTAKRPLSLPVLDNYYKVVEGLPGVKTVKLPYLKAFYVAPNHVIKETHQIADILAELVRNLGQAG
jgi:hypothetical protein